MKREIGSDFWDMPMRGYAETFMVSGIPSDWAYTFFISGRSAIYAAACTVQKRSGTVLLPYYTCETVSKALLKAGFRLLRYPVGRDLCYDPETVLALLEQSKPDILFLHGYFGFDTLPQVQRITEAPHRQGATVIEDLTHSLFSDVERSGADIYIGSLRKFFGISGGGFAAAAEPVPAKDGELRERLDRAAAKAFADKAKYMTDPLAENKQVFLDEYAAVRAVIAEADDSYRMPDSAAAKLPYLDRETMIRQRRENYRLLQNGLSACSWLEPLHGDLCPAETPLFYPVFVPAERRREIQKYFAENQVYLPVIWPKDGTLDTASPSGDEIYSRILCFLCDQRYDAADMERIVELAKAYQEPAMKKIVIMGGGVNQVPLISAAKEMGYHTVLCDANDRAYARDMADTFIQTDISDADALIRLCREQNADGIISNTESLMEVLAKVQTACGYAGNTAEAVRNINDKYLFRAVQRNAGVFSPALERFSEFDALQAYASKLDYAVILKPEMCSGSRGVFVFQSPAEITEEAFATCASYSRNHCVMLEQFVDFSDKPALEAEAFLWNGELRLLCLFRTLRDKKRNILPQCYCADNELEQPVADRIREELQRIFTASGIQMGEYNVELSFNAKGEIFVIEINARQGGMMLPDFVGLYTGIDINRLLVSAAVSDLAYMESLDMDEAKWNKNCIHFRVLTDRSGIYRGYSLNADAEQYVAKRFSYSHPGDTITCRDHNYATVELLDFVFPDRDTRKAYEQLVFDAAAVHME